MRPAEPEPEPAGPDHRTSAGRISPDATMLLELGPRVLVHQMMQDDPERQARVIRGLAWNASSGTRPRPGR